MNIKFLFYEALTATILIHHSLSYSTENPGLLEREKRKTKNKTISIGSIAFAISSEIWHSAPLPCKGWGCGYSTDNGRVLANWSVEKARKNFHSGFWKRLSKFRTGILVTSRCEGLSGLKLARGVLPYMGYMGMCRPKGYGFSAVLVINRVFTTIATNLAIWLANLPLSIRVQTTLPASLCHALKKHFLWRWYYGEKANRMWFMVVCTLIDTDMRHHSGQNLLWTHEAQHWVSPQHFDQCDDAYRCR